jgi:hypothetical protein
MKYPLEIGLNNEWGIYKAEGKMEVIPLLL